MNNEKSDGGLEELRFQTETINGRDLLKQILVDGDPDIRFLPIDQGGVFYFSPLHEFSEIRKEGVYYSLLKLNGLIVGIAQVEINPRDSTVLWLKSVSVDLNLKGQRYSEKLLREVFAFAKSMNFTLHLSKFTTEGAERLEHQIKRLAHEFSIVVTSDR